MLFWERSFKQSPSVSLHTAAASSHCAAVCSHCAAGCCIMASSRIVFQHCQQQTLNQRQRERVELYLCVWSFSCILALSQDSNCCCTVLLRSNENACSLQARCPQPHIAGTKGEQPSYFLSSHLLF